jgi:hypothetical protein
MIQISNLLNTQVQPNRAEFSNSSLEDEWLADGLINHPRTPKAASLIHQQNCIDFIHFICQPAFSLK